MKNGHTRMESKGKVEVIDRWETRKRVRRSGIRKNMERRKDTKKDIYMDEQQETEKERKEEGEEMKGRRVSGKKGHKKRSLREIVFWRLTQLPIGFVGLYPVGSSAKPPSVPRNVARDYSVTCRVSGS